MEILKSRNMNMLINEIINERCYDKSYSIKGISKMTDGIIQETAKNTNMGFELTTEVLINIGAMYITEFIKDK